MQLKIFGWVIVGMMLAALFIGGALPQAAGLVPVPWDKLAHFAFFLIFAFLLSRFAGVPVLVTLAISMLVGGLDEYHQLYLPGRMAGWDDWLADVIGACLGVIRFPGKIPKG